MTCGVCGIEVATMLHQFHDGPIYHFDPLSTSCDATCWPPRPHPHDWKIEAPLYFKLTPDGRGCEVPFCGPRCATDYALAEMRP